MRRLRSALAGVAEAVAGRAERLAAVQRYLKQLDSGIDRSALDPEDRLVASQEDRQGLGLSRKRPSAEGHGPTRAASAAADAAPAGDQRARASLEERRREMAHR